MDLNAPEARSEDKMTKIQLISPVDGQVYAEREPLSRDAAVAAVARAKAAQMAADKALAKAAGPGGWQARYQRAIDVIRGKP